MRENNDHLFGWGLVGQKHELCHDVRHRYAITQTGKNVLKRVCVLIKNRTKKMKQRVEICSTYFIVLFLESLNKRLPLNFHVNPLANYVVSHEGMASTELKKVASLEFRGANEIFRALEIHFHKLIVNLWKLLLNSN